MSKPLWHVKNETRILGLDTCNPRIIIGAVVRGGLYLDGVVTFPKRMTTELLSKSVLGTKYFPELRLIMVHDPKRALEIRTLQDATGLPVITVRTAKTGQKLSRRRSPRAGAKLIARNKTLDSSSLEMVLRLTRTKGPLPEPVRVAHLLAKPRAAATLSR